jgi:pimeloyl-ACP methyl ester carboxylesterase
MAAKISFSIESPMGSHTLSFTYERAGEGEPLLLLHGIGHHWQAWEPVLGILAAERDVIAVDLPGFGTSPALPDGVSYDLTNVGSLLGSLCEALEIERPHVAGNSLGGLLALELGR